MKNNSVRQKSSRIRALQRALKAARMDACLIEEPTNLFYFTHLQLSHGKLLVHRDKAILFVDGRYIQVASQNAPVDVELEKGAALLSFCKKYRTKVIGFDETYTTVSEYSLLKKRLKGIELSPCSTFFKRMRSIKDKTEIQRMRASAKLLWCGFEHLLTLVKAGITEKELAKRFEIFCLEEGADRLGFEPIIAFGENSAMPHHRAGKRALKEGDLILIDIGVVLNRYHSDMTRMLFFGREDPALKSLYRIVRKAHAAALRAARPGVTVGELDRVARAVMTQSKVDQLYLHALGHGLGLEIHEFPRLKFSGVDHDVVLEAGMVFTIEPGLYIPQRGGVRYEDTVVITPQGHENFYPSFDAKVLPAKKKLSKKFIKDQAYTGL